MNQQNQGSASLTPSDVPLRRKRGRPRKEEIALLGENMPVMPASDIVTNNTKQTAGTTDDSDDQMVGQVVTGVIEGVFDAGYLLNVQVADTDTFLRGVVFLPGRVAPITAENDVAPHVRMVKRKEIPIPVLNPQTQVLKSVPSSGQCSKQPVESETPVPNSEDQVPPTELHSGISVSVENQFASIIEPMADLPKNDTSIATGGIPQRLSEPGHENQSVSILSELECDEIAKQDETLHELDVSRKVKELIADVAVKDSEPASEPINVVPRIENTDKEPTTGQQAVTAVDKLNKLIHEEPKSLNIELNKTPVSAEPKPVPSEQTSKSIDNFVEKQASPKADILPEINSKVAFDTSSEVDTSNSNGTQCTGGVIFDVGSNPALETSHPSILFDGEAVISESKVLSEGSVFPEMSDPQNLSSPGAITQVHVIQPNESLDNIVESENPIGADNS